MRIAWAEGGGTGWWSLPSPEPRFGVHLDHEKPWKDFNQEVSQPDFWFRDTGWLVVKKMDGERVKL